MTTFTIRPTSDNSVGLSPGSNNYQQIDEETKNSADYVSKAVSDGYLGGTFSANGTDKYGMTDHSSEAGPINKITIKAICKYAGSTNGTISGQVNLGVYIGSTLYQKGVANLTTSEATYEYELTENPATTDAWEWSEIDALICSLYLYVYLICTAEKDVLWNNTSYCVQYWVEVTYEPITQKSIAGTLNLSGTLGRKIKVNKAGTLDLSGAVIGSFRLFKTLAGTLNLSGTLSSVWRQAKTLAGSLSFTGAISIKIKKTLAGTLNLTGALVAKYFIQLAGVLNMSGSIGIKIKKSLSGILSFSGSLNRKIKLALAGTLNMTGAASSILRLIRYLIATFNKQNVTVELNKRSIVVYLGGKQ